MRAHITPLGGGDPEPWLLEQLAHARGVDDGVRRGREQGLQEGYDHGYKNGYAEGNTAGYNEAIDEGNAVIERMQAQSVTYQHQAAANYQAYGVELDLLRQALVKQATNILALEEQLGLRDQAARQQQAIFDSQLESYQRLKQQSEILQKDLTTLTQQAHALQQEKADLAEAVKQLEHASDAIRIQVQAKSEQYNKTLVFINAIKATVESLIEQHPTIADQVNSLFAGEYKKAVEFRMLTDEIKVAPHEDSDFKLLLPQTHNLILRLLKKSSNN
jgi:chromosome segregation ATPase